MKQLGLIFLLLGSFCWSTYAQMQPVGQWREHLEFRLSQRVALSDDFIYVASKYGVYSVDRKEQIVERMSKVTGLNDIGVKTIGYNPSGNQLLIAYNNSNLDLVYRNDVINIPYIYRSNVTGDKTINDISFFGDYAYLSSNLGVIVVSLKKYEISNTYYIGNGGGNVKVYGVAANATQIYAATDEGIKVASQSNTNLNDYRNWATLNYGNGMPSGPIKQVFILQNKVYAQYYNQLYRLNGTQWEMIYNDSWNWQSVTASDGAVLICEERNDWGERKVLVLNPDGTILKTIENNNSFRYPFHAVKSGNDVFVADFDKGLITVNGSSFNTLAINSPYGPLDGQLLFSNNKLYVGGGSINDAWNYQYNGTGFFVYQEDQWKDYNRSNTSWMDSVFDIITIAVDPRDEKIYAGSFGGGLIEFESPVKYKIYKQGTAIGETVGDPTSYRIGGLSFDIDNNLWISNFGASMNLVVKKADGGWKQLSVPYVIKDNMVGAILIDDYNQKWIQAPQGNGLFCYNHGTSVDNTGDDRWKWFRTGRGNGNLPGDFVNCMVKDKDGFIWLGTDKGIGIIQCPGEVFTSNGCETFQPVVQQDNFAGLLFASEDVKAIAVDGANRKWVGTRNGVWLISADGEKVIQRFTTDNSPLLGNEINNIVIDPANGEVYFSTFNGICSYRGTATDADASDGKVLVFPNPVPSGYSGTIAIKGLAANSIVKITELNGRLVYQTRALGGQAVWDGRDYKGGRASSGVYLVLATDETGIEKTVTKIVFIK